MDLQRVATDIKVDDGGIWVTLRASGTQSTDETDTAQENDPYMFCVKHPDPPFVIEGVAADVKVEEDEIKVTLTFNAAEPVEAGLSIEGCSPGRGTTQCNPG